MDLTTFIKPETLPASALRAPGQPAPSLPHIETLHGRPYVMVLMRHIGCPFAEIALLESCRAADEYPDVEFVVVTQANWGESKAWAQKVGGGGRIHIFPDPDRRLYAAWGLGLSDWRHFLGGQSLRAVMSLYRHTGVHNRHPVGTRWQRGGAFAVDATGHIRFTHLDEHAGDPVDIDAAVASISAISA